MLGLALTAPDHHDDCDNYDDFDDHDDFDNHDDFDDHDDFDNHDDFDVHNDFDTHGDFDFYDHIMVMRKDGNFRQHIREIIVSYLYRPDVLKISM